MSSQMLVTHQPATASSSDPGEGLLPNLAGQLALQCRCSGTATRSPLTLECGPWNSETGAQDLFGTVHCSPQKRHKKRLSNSCFTH